MQFYIIHKDPETNSKLLPDYALKQVNIRGGWQIISDIGYIHEVTWEGQSKIYNQHDNNILQYYVNQERFKHFIECYVYCLVEYEKRFDSKTIFHDYFYTNYTIIIDMLKKIKNQSRFEAMREYILERKSQFMTDEEIKKIKG